MCPPTCSHSLAHAAHPPPPAEGIEVWTEDGARTLDDQSIVQLRLTRTDTPTQDTVAEVLQQLAPSLPLKALRDDETTQG